MAPSSAVPPSLPPSVEEAYRRKCVQLKNRTNEVEEANDAARLRLARIKRQVEKLRLERAFLLEQMARRTSTNVEDSEGSPSPPPVEPRTEFPPEPEVIPRKPRDKPPRSKRGHRKASAAGEGDLAQSTGGNEPRSPGSDSFSQTATQDLGAESQINATDKRMKQPKNAFFLFCDEVRPTIESEEKEEEVNMDEILESRWKELPDAEKQEYQKRFEEEFTRPNEEEDKLKTKEREPARGREKGKGREKDKSKAKSRSVDEEEGVEAEDSGPAPRKNKDEAEEKGEGDSKDKEEGKSEAPPKKKKKASEEPPKTKPEAQDDDVEMTNYDTEDQDVQMDKDMDD